MMEIRGLHFPSRSPGLPNAPPILVATEILNAIVLYILIYIEWLARHS